ncbi:MAG TPA: hypothetical protein VNZ45_13725 [Bacteroidia bacterium]|nr:hypothetical protein [Bacteroidia bacterium]
MKTFKSLIVLAALALFAINGKAQDTTAAAVMPKAQKAVNYIKEKIAGITLSQENNILAVEIEYIKEQEAAKISSKGDKDIQECKMRPLPIKRDMKIKTILTDTQYKQYTKLVKTDYKFKTDCDGYK